MEVSENIKDIIEESGLKINHIAETIGVSRVSINNWMKQNKPYQIEKVKMAIRKSQVGDNNVYTNSDASDRIVKILERLVKSQEDQIASLKKSLEDKDAVIEDSRKELKLWRQRCEECEHRLKAKKKD